MAAKEVIYPLRFDPKLYSWFQQEAQEDRRSTCFVIMRVLEDYKKKIDSSRTTARRFIEKDKNNKQ